MDDPHDSSGTLELKYSESSSSAGPMSPAAMGERRFGAERGVGPVAAVSHESADSA